MKLTAAKTIKSEAITEGTEYTGQIVSELKDGKTEYKIVVYNSHGKWSAYPLSYFYPAE